KQRRISNLNLLALGKELADWLLPAGTIRELFSHALKLAKNRGGVRLRLIIASHELKQIPWEFVYNPLSRADSAFDFLALDPRLSIVRHEPLDMPHRRPISIEKGTQDIELRLFAASASPQNITNIAVDYEMQGMKQILSEKQRFGEVKITPTFYENASWQDVQQALNQQGNFHICHFAGHGKVETEENNLTFDDVDLGRLLFSDQHDRKQPITAGSFADLMQHSDIWMVTLGACDTGIRTTEHPWHSVAGALIEHDIPVVIAMQNEIGDEAAVTFGREFYSMLAGGLSLDEAMSWSRRQMAARLRDENAQINDMEWGVPVLYTRLADGVLVPELVKQGSKLAKKTRKEIQAEATRVWETEINVDQEVGTIHKDGDVIGVNAKGKDTRGKQINVKQKAKKVKGKMIGAEL
ncbi:MAG: CHAT domain-containing protein, partial [Chloroflexota bacterium]